VPASGIPESFGIDQDSIEVEDDRRDSHAKGDCSHQLSKHGRCGSGASSRRRELRRRQQMQDDEERLEEDEQSPTTRLIAAGRQVRDTEAARFAGCAILGRCPRGHSLEARLRGLSECFGKDMTTVDPARPTSPNPS